MRSRPLHHPTPDGEADAVLHLPDAPGPHPLVVLCMDAFGLRPALTEMAAPFVAAGYAVVTPNLYWRSGPFAPFHAATTFRDPPERTRVMALMNAVSPSQVATDTAALLDSLATDPAIRPGPVGLVGYCMGGRQAFYLAAALGDRVAAMASIHGGGLVRPDASSPHHGAARIRARCYFAVADQDPSCTPADCEALATALTAAGVRHEIELYPGKLHGFAAPDMSVYDAAAAAHHVDRVVALYREALGS